MRLFNPASENPLSLCRKYVFAFSAIFVLVFSLYSNTFNSSWHFDDEQNIEKNEKLHITAFEWKSIKGTFFASPEVPGKVYRPVATFTFALNYLFGKNNVFGYHLLNVSIHFLAAIFLFLFIHNALNLPRTKPRYGPDSYFIALLSTIFWAVNPLQTQAITYIVQRMASLAAMFYIMSMYFYLKGRNSNQSFLRSFCWFALALMSGLLAVGSKENAAMLPFSIFLFDLFLIQGITKKSVAKNLLVFALLTLIPLGLAFILTGASFRAPAALFSGYEERGFTMFQRLLTEPRVIVFYISLLFYPMPNRLCITHAISPSVGLFQPIGTFLSIFMILFILFFSVLKSKKLPLISYCIIFFFINHIIESTLLPLELVFEHRNYLPSMLFFVPATILIVKSIKFFSGKPGMQYAITILVIVLLIGFGHSTFVRNFTWKTKESLWLDAVDKNLESIRAHHNLGRYYSDNNQRRKAILEYRTALKLHPETYGERYYLTHYNLGLVYLELGKNKEAKQHFEKAIALFPGFADAYCNLGLVMAKEGNYDAAYKTLITSLTFERNSSQAHNNLGYVLMKKNQFDQAIIEFQKALRLQNGFTTALRNLGITYKHKKAFRMAIHYFRRVLEKNPKDLQARLYLAEAYSLADKNEFADQTIFRALDLFGPEKLYMILRKLLKDDTFMDLSDKSIVLPLLKKAFLARAEFLKQKGNVLGKED